MLRRWKHIALLIALALCARASNRVLADPPEIVSDGAGTEQPASEVIQDSPPAELELPPEGSFRSESVRPEPLLPPETTLQSAPESTEPAVPLPPHTHEFSSVPEGEPEAMPAEPQSEDPFFAMLKRLGFRHSSTSGRSAGLGIPLVGTSWLNRPYYFGADLGTVWVTRPVNDHMTEDVDMVGDIFGGCDWDYYWGTELDVHRATPELINEHARDADRGDRMMEWTASLMYYPWGDSMFRPYWRCGIGATDIDYPTDGGHRRDEELWTFPVGVGIKYPIRHWLAARAEFADQLALGNSGVATQHDLTLTFGLEWRFGARPRSYWPWNPSRHIW